MSNQVPQDETAERLSLVETFLEVAAGSGESLNVVAEAVTEATDVWCSAQRLGEWRRGDRPIPQPVQNFMLQVAIERAILMEYGLPPSTDEGLDRLAARLSPPARRRR